MIEILPAALRPIRSLRKLADMPFGGDLFKPACEEIGPFDAASSDDHLWMFTVAPEWPLVVALDEGGLVSCAILSFCWLPVTHDVTAEDSQQFNAVYAEERARAIDVMGSPLWEGREERFGYQWALWRGSTGLLVLQQSDYDLQVGEDVNYWIKRWSGEFPEPAEPFLDWLMNAETT